MTIARVDLLEAFSRFGCSTGRHRSAMPADHTIRAGRVRGSARAGVVELVDTPALGAGGASRGGSSPSARTHAPVSVPSRTVTAWPGEVDAVAVDEVRTSPARADACRPVSSLRPRRLDQYGAKGGVGAARDGILRDAVGGGEEARDEVVAGAGVQALAVAMRAADAVAPGDAGDGAEIGRQGPHGGLVVEDDEQVAERARRVGGLRRGPEGLGQSVGRGRLAQAARPGSRA